MTDAIRISSPADILGFIPHSLGFVPRESFVFLTMRGKTLGATLRVDAPTAAEPAGFARSMREYLALDTQATAVLLAIFALGILGSTTNLDLLVGLQRVGMLQPASACALAALSLSAVTIASADLSDLLGEFSGVDLAIVALAEDLRLLFWLNLIAAVFLPIGMANAAAANRNSACPPSLNRSAPISGPAAIPR